MAKTDIELKKLNDGKLLTIARMFAALTNVGDSMNTSRARKNSWVNIKILAKKRLGRT